METLPARFSLVARSRWLETVGRTVLDLFNEALDLATLLVATVRALLFDRTQGKRVVWNVFLRQILFTGVEGLPVVSVVALMLGAIVIVQSMTQLPQYGAEHYVGTVLTMVIVRELAPLMTAFIVIGRSGTAISTEIGNMIVGHEIEAIEMMGVSPMRFIVVPRVVGVTIAVVCLNLYFTFVALLGGFLVARVKLTTPFGVFLARLADALSMADIVTSLLKSAAFGLLISLICIYYGFRVRLSSTEVPQVTTHAVVRAIFLCFVTNALITALFYLT